MLTLDELRELPFDPDYNGSAVYFLWRGPKLCYIGQSRQFAVRMEQHEAARDGFASGKQIPFDAATYLRFPDGIYLRPEESRYLWEYRPPFNVWIPHCQPF